MLGDGCHEDCVGVLTFKHDMRPPFSIPVAQARGEDMYVDLMEHYLDEERVRAFGYSIASRADELYIDLLEDEEVLLSVPWEKFHLATGARLEDPPHVLARELAWYHFGQGWNTSAHVRHAQECPKNCKRVKV